MKTLILIDLQNDYMPWGSIGIEGADDVVPLANQLMEKFDVVVASQDWHPANHKSFAANHPWRLPGQILKINEIPQMLWTIHCVQDTIGAELVHNLNTTAISKIIKNGMNPEMDSYSVFFENGKNTSNNLEEFLQLQNVKEVFILGMAAEFGVKHSAIDSVGSGFKTSVIIDGCYWYNPDEENIRKTIHEMESHGVQIIHSDKL